MNGPDGDLTADRIELFLSRQRRRARARGSRRQSRSPRRQNRRAYGDHLTYIAAKDEYTMVGKPVKVFDDTPPDCKLTVGHDFDIPQVGRYHQRDRQRSVCRDENRDDRVRHGGSALNGHADDTHDLTKSYGGRTVVSRRQPRDRVRRSHRPARAERRRQDDDVLDGRRADRPRLGPRPARRHRRHRRPDVHPGAQGHRLPAAGSVDLPRADGRAEHPRDPRDARPRRARRGARACASCSRSSA